MFGYVDTITNNIIITDPIGISGRSYFWRDLLRLDEVDRINLHIYEVIELLYNKTQYICTGYVYTLSDDKIIGEPILSNITSPIFKVSANVIARSSAIAELKLLDITMTRRQEDIFKQAIDTDLASLSNDQQKVLLRKHVLRNIIRNISDIGDITS